MSAATLLDTSSNELIRKLSARDKRLLVGCLRFETRRGQRIIDPREPLDGLYFPETTLLSIVDGTTSGEVAVIGREGFAGWSILLGCTHTPYLAHSCTRNGSYLWVPREAAQRALVQSISFRGALLPYVDALAQQIAANGQSYARDRLLVRIARWIKMRHDRIPGDEILVHHSEIADCLTIRRASVTDALHLFEGDAILRCRRGRIIVRDASRLHDACATRARGPISDIEASGGSQRANG